MPDNTGTKKQHRQETVQVNVLNVGTSSTNYDLDATNMAVLDAVNASDKLVRTVTVSLAAATGNGGLLAWANPEGATIIVTSFIAYITTESTGAANADFGAAANGSTSSDTLLDGVDIGTAADIFSNNVDGGTNGGPVAVGSTQYITGTASADPAGLVGKVYISYILA